MTPSHRLILCTCPDQDTALRIAEHLIQERLAACVNLMPGITSIYLWEGRMQRDPEVLALIKTTVERVAALTGRLRQLHPYAVPEIIAVPITEGLPDYLSWVTTCTNNDD
ncbi:MAG: divalent-cation tolerance protein CutA [Thiocapsa sp.]|jgi:periplasmic divalent cation tolerance protein|nr:divalent-cation tolerance protein CutA [Thiocapsa sp.]MCG6895587.1 divalent-cation tolerance protein CutA [Thiocapsa sp.]MCG6985934.1 divalent-cation tolerance protein CutA [Thiocapsa sp.]